MPKSTTGLTSASLPNVDQKPKSWKPLKDGYKGSHKGKKRRGMNPSSNALKAMMLARMMQARQAPPLQQPQLQMGPPPGQAMPPYGGGMG